MKRGFEQDAKQLSQDDFSKARANRHFSLFVTSRPGALDCGFGKDVASQYAEITTTGEEADWDSDARLEAKGVLMNLLRLI